MQLDAGTQQSTNSRWQHNHLQVKYVARTRDRLSLWKIWWLVSAVLVLSCGQTHTHERLTPMTVSNSASKLGTCKASRFEFESDDSDSIRKWRADSKFSIPAHLPSYHKPRSLFNKKLQPLHCCNWDLFYVYDFMFMQQEQTHSLAL